MKEKGITLIALIITIILMLILSSVAITGVINGGVFNYAGKAASKVELYSIIEELEAAGIMKGKKNLNGRLSEVLGEDYGKYDSSFKVVNGELVYLGDDSKTVENLFELGLKESSIKKASAVCAVLGHDFIPANYLNPKTCTRCGYKEGEKLIATAPHPGQKNTTNIGIGTDGQLVNLDNWTYQKTSGTWQLTAYVGTYSEPGGEIEGKVPQMINDIEVTSMQDTFKDNTNLKIAPEIPTTITTMDSSFRGCTALTTGSIIPYGVENVNKTFYGCTSLVTLPDGFTLPDSITGRNIMYTFEGCTNLEELPDSFAISKNTTSIYYFFEGCTNLKKLPDGFTLPNNITEMGGAFKNCKALEELPDSFRLPVNNNNSCGRFFEGCSGLKRLPTNFTIPEGCTSTSGMFNGCSELESLPDNFTLSSTVKTINQMFQGCSKLSSLPNSFTIPNGVTNLSYAFYQCSNLASIPTDLIIPESVSNFGLAFRSCPKLEGSIIMDCAPSNISNCLQYTATSGNGLTVKYTSKCTNIEAIMATKSNNSNITSEAITLPTVTE